MFSTATSRHPTVIDMTTESFAWPDLEISGTPFFFVIFGAASKVATDQVA